ncbi:competence type IV pilus minor pilin ComGG [Ectobacillus antri]|uniref:Competence type IV pilus minor pilin ComGG n=1 Tax=Ectobacillus antri TaxID=2486280 RepID=A0ABT6H3L9_9BACI|nr:competence type IV pilus minor pilin ComGG [Ectobacillus antri]MDG4655561.1 competence type IV pilus minor pilin ComGG [Ectobacillus antri]MDG5753319.1 competence type IV pilus minor pilin ComGG [Ectobacillus antri]
MKERGFVMPVTIAFSFILLALLIHQANILLMEKRFYQEGEALLALDIIMYRALADLHTDIVNGHVKDTYVYEEGQVTFAAIDSSKYRVECRTKQNHVYKAVFSYNKETKQILIWSEERT